MKHYIAHVHYEGLPREDVANRYYAAPDFKSAWDAVVFEFEHEHGFRPDQYTIRSLVEEGPHR